MATIEITKDNFEETINNNEIVFFDFWAPWCGPCRSFGPIYEEAAKKHPDAVFAKVNTEDQPELAGALNISSIPTLMAFKEQIGVFSQPGALPAEMFDDLITKVRAIDMDDVRKQMKAEQS
jgi:thioredoxin 1